MAEPYFLGRAECKHSIGIHNGWSGCLTDSSVTFGTYPDDFETKCDWKSNFTVLTIMFRILKIVRHHYRTNNLKSLIKIDCDSLFLVFSLSFSF